MLDDDASAFIETAVRGGFLARDEIVEAAMEITEDTAAASADEIVRHVDEVAQALAREQASWPSVTDSDRLDAAFAELERSGILARQDFTCCQSCGHAEIWDEAVDPSAWRGYAFYHRQDTEAAVEGRGLYLGFGSTGGRAAETASIGAEIVAALHAQGLAVDWDGDVRKRIGVGPFTWRRRLDPEAFGIDF
jgi:hypothetical protein